MIKLHNNEMRNADNPLHSIYFQCNGLHYPTSTCETEHRIQIWMLHGIYNGMLN